MSADDQPTRRVAPEELPREPFGPATCSDPVAMIGLGLELALAFLDVAEATADDMIPPGAPHHSQ